MDLQKQAEILAALHYVEYFKLDVTTNGQPVYLAFSPELEGCLGQGESPEEAIENLRQARVDFIYSLLEDGLPVPLPQSHSTETSPGVTSTLTRSSSGQKDLIRASSHTNVLNLIMPSVGS